MRKLIAGMKVSADGRMEGPEGMADWVEAWSEDYGLTPRIDTCVLGGGMYPGYERYWTAIRDEPDTPAWINGQVPTAAERDWAAFAARTPHLVLSSTLDAASWPSTRFIRQLGDIAALKRQPGKDIYLVGGATLLASAIEAGLLDELRLIVYPLVAGEGRPVFSPTAARRGLTLHGAEPMSGGRLKLVYGLD